MGWITALLTSGPARKALGLLLAERLSTSERTHEIQRQMLDAASRRPADRDALAQRMRDGRF